MRHNVRHLSVGYGSNAAAVPERMLLQALENIKNLASFTWCTWVPIPASILHCLGKLHPSTQLKVIARERNNLSLDVLPITSPQLHTLDVKLSVVYAKTVPKSSNTGSRGYKGQSELNYLKSLILKSSSLKVLCLEFCEIKHGSKEAQSQLQNCGPAEYDPITFKFQKHEMLPALEELTLRTMFNNDGNRTTPWQAWRAHQDWTKLRKLDLDHNANRKMIQSLMGAVPALETLILKVEQAAPYHDTFELYEKFLRSVTKLTTLCIRGHKNTMLGVVFQTVSPQLKCLEMDIGPNLQAWRRVQFEEILSHCFKLERLLLQGGGYISKIQAEWTTHEARLPVREKIAQLVQYSCEDPYRPRRGDWYRGAHSAPRSRGIVPMRPKWLSTTDKSGT